MIGGVPWGVILWEEVYNGRLGLMSLGHWGVGEFNDGFLYGFGIFIY